MTTASAISRWGNTPSPINGHIQTRTGWDGIITLFLPCCPYLTPRFLTPLAAWWGGGHGTVGADGGNTTRPQMGLCLFLSLVGQAACTERPLPRTKARTVTGLTAHLSVEPWIHHRRRIQRGRISHSPHSMPIKACNQLHRNKESITPRNSKVCFRPRCHGWEPQIASVARASKAARRRLDGNYSVRRLRSSYSAQPNSVGPNHCTPVQRKTDRFFVRQQRRSPRGLGGGQRGEALQTPSLLSGLALSSRPFNCFESPIATSINKQTTPARCRPTMAPIFLQSRSTHPESCSCRRRCRCRCR